VRIFSPAWGKVRGALACTNRIGPQRLAPDARENVTGRRKRFRGDFPVSHRDLTSVASVPQLTDLFATVRLAGLPGRISTRHHRCLEQNSQADMAPVSLPPLRLAGAIGFVALAIQFVPYGPPAGNPPTIAEPRWDSASTRSLAKRACFDCHGGERIDRMPEADLMRVRADIGMLFQENAL
jgi:hypothetical protein